MSRLPKNKNQLQLVSFSFIIISFMLLSLLYILNQSRWNCFLTGNMWTSFNDPSYHFCVSSHQYTCLKSNGLWDGKHCALPALDAIKECNDSSDCQGYCQATALESGETGTGRCSDYVFPADWKQGCKQEILNGIAQIEDCHPDFELID